MLRYSYIKAEKSKKTYHTNNEFRCRQIIRSAKSRSKKMGFPSDLDEDELSQQMLTGRCAVTGVPFLFDKIRGPFTPSLDRIDPSKGYTKDNVRLVSWIFNRIRSDYEEEDVLRFIEALRNMPKAA